MAQNRWEIHKFGGSSLADADCFRRVAAILTKQTGTRIAAVVSAMAGMTDKLLRLAVLAEQDDDSYASEIHRIGERYADTARELLAGDALIALLDLWGQDAADIEDILRSIARLKSAPQRSRDVVAGYGEIWAARLLASLLEQQAGSQRGGTWIDAREIVTVRASGLGPTVLWHESREKFARVVDHDFEGIAVVTGFIASDEDGLQTTLGRNGSDHSAAIFAALANAGELSIWSDVDGIMSADPNKVPEARVIEQLSYSEAMELAYFGAKVLHPQTLGPAVENNIPIVIRNSFDPDHPGSRIVAEADPDQQIKGITAIGDMALVNLEGSGMIGVPGTADRLFAALKKAGVSVTLISQASSEHSICVAVPQELADRARDVISDAFSDELSSGQIQSVDTTDAQSIVAVVGDAMAGTPGLAAKFFGTLGRAGINVRAIAQGASERNISAVVDSDDAVRALRAAHSGFYLSSKTISIGLIGPGTVGSTLLEQIQSRSERLLDEFNLDLRVRAIARSRKMLLDERRIPLESWREILEDSGEARDLDRFERHVHADHLPHAVIIDCTASESVARRYSGWLGKGIHVITPNKKAFSSEYSYYRSIRDSAKDGSSHYFYETTVGAALPVISTLRDLVGTGDQIRAVEGILSGTLAYLFNVYDGTRPFSEIVRRARTSGYTEPDPRDDLSGMDVARKLTILARELGQQIEIGDFAVENLVAPDLRGLSVDQFFDALPSCDDQMLELYLDAKSRGRNLRYVAKLDANGGAIAEVAASLWKMTQRGRGERWGGRVEAPAAVDQHLPMADS
ncbi:MAG: bifunctional aspartate kinase/homoserine dehydrogenase I, partial [Woeseia sp.]